MTLPTPEEIKAARDAIKADGPGHPQTLALAHLAMLDRETRDFAEYAVDGAILLGIPQRYRELLLPLVLGGVTCGLNLGLRIGEARQHES